MARPLRIDYPGALHHIFFRGNRKEDIFEDNADRYQFLNFLSENKNRFSEKIYAYCLMNNHVHLVVESGPVHIGNFMRQLLTSYVQYFNNRWSRAGHLLQDRYKSILIDKDSYLLILIKYIHLNPVNAGFCKEPEDYVWSSHIEYLNKREPIVDIQPILSRFKNIKEYEKFIKDVPMEKISVKKYRRYAFYGDEEFINKALEKISLQKREKGSNRIEITLGDVERFIKIEFAKDVKSVKKYRNTDIKRVATIIMRDRLHYTLRRIGDIIGIKYSSVYYLYKTSNKEEILNKFFKFLNSHD